MLREEIKRGHHLPGLGYLCLLICPCLAEPCGKIIFSPAAADQEITLDSALFIGKAPSAPVLDGRIDSKEWALAGFGGFEFKAAVANRTSVLALYDQENLYFAFRCREPNVKKIVALHGPGKAGKYAPNENGDCPSYYDDSIEIFISPDKRQEVIYQFIANTIGGHMDIRYDPPKSDQAYTSGFRSAAQKGIGEWSIEFAVPLEAIGLKNVQPGRSIRLNFGRNRRVGGGEIAGWQGFWAWRGQMALAVFAPRVDFAVGDIRFGPKRLGRNQASVRVRTSRRTAKIRLKSKMKQNGEIITNEGEWARAKRDQANNAAVQYVVARPDQPFEFALSVEGGGIALELNEDAMWPSQPLSGFLERKEYDPFDGPITAFFNLNLSRESLGDYQLQCTLVSQTKQVAEMHSDIRTAAGEVQFILDNKKAVDYSVKLSLLGKDGQAVHSIDVDKLVWNGETKAPVTTGRIPLKLDVFKGVANPTGTWLVTAGVPFSKGALKSSENVRLLDPSGKEVPAEISVPATWDRAGTSIKWLHVKAMVNFEDRDKSYSIDYGPNVRRTPFNSKLKTSQTDRTITVDTGRLKFTCSKLSFRFIDTAWLDLDRNGSYDQKERIITPGPSHGLLVETTDGKVYRSDTKIELKGASSKERVQKVELESVGPMEAVIRAEGWHTEVVPGGDGPVKMMKYIVRIVATADSSLLRIFHTFILTQDEETQYRQVTLTLSLPDDETSLAALSRTGNRMRPAELKPGAKVWFTQLDYDAFRAYLRSPEHGKAIRALEGGSKSAGWLQVKRKGWGVTLATRDFWQNYAKGYEVTRDSITLCPWPKDALWPLSFRPEDVIAPVFVKNLAMYTTGGIEGQGNNYSSYTHAVGSSPRGVSKTHEYLLDFTTEPSLERGRTVQQLLDDPPLLVVPKEYACATEVIGKIHPSDSAKYAVEEAGFNAMLKRLEYGKPEHRHWGLVNFGESYQSLYDDGRLYFYRTYQNAGYGIVNDFYRGYLRTGSRDWFRYAVRRTRHNRDIDHCHYGPKIGGQTPYDALNWGTAFAIQTFWTHRQFLLLDWYITGDRRSWDTFLLAAEATKNLQHGTGAKDDRHWFNIPKELIEMYRATWDSEHLKAANGIVEGILLAKEKAGPDKWPKNALPYNEYLQPSFLVYHRYTRNPRVLEYLKQHFKQLKGKQGYSTGLAQDAAAYLYWQTGDASWLEQVGGYESMRGYMRLYETNVPPPVGGTRRMMVSEALGWMKNWSPKQRRVFHAHFGDKGFHHAFERLWYFMAAVDDAKLKDILKPYKGPNNPWTDPVWDVNYWNTATPEQKKEWGWK
mgnify:CR=1 FL=1